MSSDYNAKFNEWKNGIPTPSTVHIVDVGDEEYLQTFDNDEFEEYLIYILKKLIPNDTKDNYIAKTMAHRYLYVFKTSLTHPTYDSEENYESLETMGDKVLGCYFALYLLSIKPDAIPDQLTSAQRFYMSKVFQPTIAKDFKMDKWISSLSSALSDKVYEDVYEAFTGALHKVCTKTRRYFLDKYEKNPDNDVDYAIYATKCNPDVVILRFIEFYFKNIKEEEFFNIFVRKTTMFEYKGILAFTKEEKPFDEYKKTEEDEKTGEKFVKFYVKISDVFIRKWYKFVGRNFTFGKDLPIKYEGTDEEEVYNDIYNRFNALGYGRDWLMAQRSYPTMLESTPGFKDFMVANGFKKTVVQFIQNLDGFKIIVHLFYVDGSSKIFTTQSDTKNSAVKKIAGKIIRETL